MARPMKSGLEYYPMDVGFLRDKKVRLLRAEFGASSVVFVLYVFGKVYEGDGYFLTWDKDELTLAANELNESPGYISEVLQGCLKRSIFDKRVFQMFGVLTSAGIQRRYLRGCEKRGGITIRSEYWLLDIDSSEDVPAGIRAKLALNEATEAILDEKTAVLSQKTRVSSPGNPQSKVKESKVKYSKEGTPRAREENVMRSVPYAPSKEAVEEYAKLRGRPEFAEPFYDYYSASGWRDSENKPVYNWQQKFVAWELREAQRAKDRDRAVQKNGLPTKASRPSDPKADMERMDRYLKKLREGGG